MSTLTKQKWLVVQLAIASFYFCAALTATDAPASQTLEAAVLATLVALVTPVLLLLVLALQAVSPWSAPEWPYPKHSENPFDFKYPLRFFYFVATCAAAGALGSLVSGIWRGKGALPAIALTTGAAIGLWLGVNSAWRLLRWKRAVRTSPSEPR